MALISRYVINECILGGRPSSSSILTTTFAAAAAVHNKRENKILFSLRNYTPLLSLSLCDALVERVSGHVADTREGETRIVL